MNVFAKGLLATVMTFAPLAHGNALELTMSQEFKDVMLGTELTETPTKACFVLLSVKQVTDEATMMAAYKLLVRDIPALPLDYAATEGATHPVVRALHHQPRLAARC